MAEQIQVISNIQLNEEPGGIAEVAPVEVENSTPFQVMLDAALQGLESVSAIEEKSNVYIAQYARGNVSMEEVMIEMTKMTMAVEMATSVVNQVVTTFKEIQQMPV